jgi:hypothetical protein
MLRVANGYLANNKGDNRKIMNFTNFFSCGFSKFQSLSKDAIGKLHGGKFRGERVFVMMERNSTSCEFYEAKVWNQMQSQDSGSFPEGYVRVRTGQARILDYDIASGTVRSMQFQWSRDLAEWRKLPKRRKAWILTSAPGTPTYGLLRYYSNRRVVEENVFSLILNSTSETQTAAMRIIEEEIGLVVTSRAPNDEELGLLWDHYLAMPSLRRLREIEELLELDSGRTVLKVAA